MKSKSAIILATIIGIIILGYVSIQSWIKKIEYGLKSSEIKPIKLNFQEVILRIPVWVYNPSPFNVIIKKIDFNIFLNGFFVANITSDANYLLKARNISQYPLIAKLPTKQVLNALKLEGAIIDDPNWLEKVNVSIEGHISLESGLVSIKKLNLKFDDSLKNWIG